MVPLPCISWGFRVFDYNQKIVHTQEGIGKQILLLANVVRGKEMSVCSFFLSRLRNRYIAVRLLGTVTVSQLLHVSKKLQKCYIFYVTILFFHHQGVAPPSLTGCHGKFVLLRLEPAAKSQNEGSITGVISASRLISPKTFSSSSGKGGIF